MNLQLQKPGLNQRELSDYLTRGIFSRSSPGIKLPQSGSNWTTPSVNPRKIDKPILTRRLNDVIEASRCILDLEDDWDEEGSLRFSEATWIRATHFVKQVALSFRQQPNGFWVDPPRILPGPKGSIDIHWKTSKRELLINIPEDKKEPADYYGSGGLTDIIKGKLETSAKNEWILAWLTR